MKTIKQTSRAKKAISLTLMIVFLSGVAYGIFAKQNNAWPFIKTTSIDSNRGRDINYQSPTDEQKDEGERIKERSVNQSKHATPSTSGEKKEVSATVTAANQNNGKFQVRFLIQVIDTGTCTLRLTKGNTTVTKTSPTQSLPSSMTCQGFDIPISELSSGEWVYTMTFAGNDYTASVTDKVTVE